MAQTEALGNLGAIHYFAPSTVATGKEHGLDGFRFYFLGRGGVLGDAESEVVASAFGYFNPDLVKKMWDSAKAIVPPREAARLYLECAYTIARERLADVEGLAAFNVAASAVNDAVDPAGLALYSGFRAEPIPDDDAARALHLIIVLREARGSAHLLGVRAAGLSPREAHQVRRPDDVATFGWEPLELDTAASGRWDEAEETTNRLMEPAFAVLDDQGREAFLTGLANIGAALS